MSGLSSPNLNPSDPSDEAAPLVSTAPPASGTTPGGSTVVVLTDEVKEAADPKKMEVQKSWRERNPKAFVALIVAAVFVAALGVVLLTLYLTNHLQGIVDTLKDPQTWQNVATWFQKAGNAIADGAVYSAKEVASFFASEVNVALVAAAAVVVSGGGVAAYLIATRKPKTIQQAPTVDDTVGQPDQPKKRTVILDSDDESWSDTEESGYDSDRSGTEAPKGPASTDEETYLM